MRNAYPRAGAMVGRLLAMVGAARIGEREILALGGEVGWETLARISSRTGSTTASSA